MKGRLQEFRNRLELRKFNNDNERNRPVHPGKILLNEFLKPTKIAIIEWPKILFILTNELKLILSGRRGLSAKMVIKLSLVFNTDIVYWIDLNNKYYAWSANAKCRKLLGKASQPVCSNHRPLALFEFLDNNFLRPMDFPRKRFLRHIGIRSGYADDFSVVPRINFDRAFKIGQAFGVDPTIFLFAQIEYNIHLNEITGKKVQRRGLLREETGPAASFERGLTHRGNSY